MSAVAFIRRCVASGMPMDMALLAADAFEAEVKIAIDQVLEPRRAKDRARKAKAPRNSAETVESVEFQETAEPLSLPLSPRTPQTPTHTRECVSTRARDEREEPAFGRFWTAYPRREGKAAARKAFAKAWRKLPPFDEEQILNGGLERAKAGWGDAQFIPHAATWLNGERWNDEPAEITPLRKAPHERSQADAKYDARQELLATHERGADAAARRWHAEHG